LTNWTVLIKPQAQKQLEKLTKSDRERVYKFLRRLETLEDPLRIARVLKGKWTGAYRFRVGKFRIICSVFEELFVIEALVIDKRSDIYD
jgi:mRNA interferase RelE/StbE